MTPLRRAVIVDDEPLARERIRTLLADSPDWTVAAECRDGLEAVAVIEREQPDLVFLDIQMPELDGFEVLDALGSTVPAIIFVTAFDEFALRAFEVSAVDYLLKPIDPTRFQRALDRVRTRMSAKVQDASVQLEQLVQLWRARQHLATRFVVRDGGTISFVKVEDVDWIDAAGNYVRLHAAGRAYLVRDTMKAVEARLDPATFVRVHRSAIVNIDRVSALEPYFHGEYVVIMRDGTRLTSSRSHSERLRALLK
ncbi:MAG TPA: LytTR family transcriptional regulator DNA-binding domain-containing protein [Gemmatimonadales bacterium]|nr:LytTR family transcriptional regulator DNA-binding domain-containing protein [Gemmatimonadales bacterium]